MLLPLSPSLNTNLGHSAKMDQLKTFQTTSARRQFVTLLLLQNAVACPPPAFSSRTFADKWCQEQTSHFVVKGFRMI